MQYSNAHIIETDRLLLVCCNQEIIETLLKGDQEIAGLLGIDVPANWTEFGDPAFRWTQEKLLNNTDHEQWLTYLPVLKENNTLIGSAGYKGDPVDGMVEIGYEVSAPYRLRGFASEIVRALVNYAMQSPIVTLVTAHTLACENESGSVLKKSRFRKTSELEDPEDGKIWRWELSKPEHQLP